MICISFFYLFLVYLYIIHKNWLCSVFMIIITQNFLLFFCFNCTQVQHEMKMSGDHFQFQLCVRADNTHAIHIIYYIYTLLGKNSIFAVCTIYYYDSLIVGKVYNTFCQLEWREREKYVERKEQKTKALNTNLRFQLSYEKSYLAMKRIFIHS